MRMRGQPRRDRNAMRHEWGFPDASHTHTDDTMAAANPSPGIRQPYHIILAGAHEAGKTTIFNTLIAEFKDSYKFKSEDKRSRRQDVQFESFHHKYMDESREMKVRRKSNNYSQSMGTSSVS